ncbi:MAG: hypothetical protein A4E54_00087 [Pelotomaculum sp. PtaB.Bin117]|nr:MAG: hypothetical protein A4E54_00087 [Pelotomaculum sp. PtaB.Bin117]OPY62885.1 MAG: hypothetical protein A4E56_01043 [Pelotomaculum sp. PtaU1.Bin065]
MAGKGVMSARLHNTGLMIGSWLSIISGRSYYHQEQPLGRIFQPGDVLGYFNDLTGKTKWRGPVSERGVPLNRKVNGSLVFIPTTIAQKALGHYDNWLLDGDSRDLDDFMLLAGWLREHQDAAGGWPIWPVLGMSGPSLYSAMVQGEAISVAVRAHLHDPDQAWIKVAEDAARLMLIPVMEGGTARYTPEGLVLEEYPIKIQNTILNGWCFALYGLYDLRLAKAGLHIDIEQALNDTLRALSVYLPRYDAGYWSYYDTANNLAGPFYHKLHIAQLRAVEETFPGIEAVARFYRVKFERQWSRVINRFRAVVKKGLQKICHPPETIIR